MVKLSGPNVARIGEHCCEHICTSLVDDRELHDDIAAFLQNFQNKFHHIIIIIMQHLYSAIMPLGAYTGANCETCISSENHNRLVGTK